MLSLPSYAPVKRDVAIIMSNFWPEPTGGSPTATEFAAFLQSSGHTVRVVTSMPYYPEWRIWKEYRGKLWLREEHKGVSIFRTWHFVRPRVSTLIRILHELTLSLLALPNMIAVLRRSGVVYLFTPALSFAWVGSMLARLFGVTRIVVVKDVMPDAAIELGMLTNPAMIKMSRFMARSLYDHAEEVHTLGDGMQRRIAAVAKPGANLRIVSDTVDGSELYPVPRSENEFRKRFVPEGTFAVLHTGNMGRKQDLGLILRTAELFRDDSAVRFYVFGDGAAKEEFLADRSRRGLHNVEHHPLQERWMLKHMLSGADVVLVSQLRSVVDIVVPSKLLTALVSGAMVVAACPPGSAPEEIVGKSGGGIVVPAEDAAALAQAINDIRAGRIDATQCRANARAYALRVFDRRAVYGPLSEELHRRLGTRAPQAATVSSTGEPFAFIPTDRSA